MGDCYCGNELFIAQNNMISEQLSGVCVCPFGHLQHVKCAENSKKSYQDDYMENLFCELCQKEYINSKYIYIKA